jgi:hypothetical protein
VHTAKCLKAKKSYCVFYTQKKNVLACILALITSLLKSREHWPKFQKQQKFYFVCLLVSGVRYVNPEKNQGWIKLKKIN